MRKKATHLCTTNWVDRKQMCEPLLKHQFQSLLFQHTTQRSPYGVVVVNSRRSFDRPSFWIHFATARLLFSRFIALFHSGANEYLMWLPLELELAGILSSVQKTTVERSLAWSSRAAELQNVYAHKLNPTKHILSTPWLSLACPNETYLKYSVPLIRLPQRNIS